MGFTDYVLYRLARNWPSPTEKLASELGATPGTEAYDMAYAQRQFDWKVRHGIMREVTGMDVLEIGTGHGGIACYLAAVGAKSVVGIDLNTKHLEFARRFAQIVAARYGENYRLPVSFVEMTADRMTFADASFDVVLADNVFEHFTDPEAVLRESYRVLRPGGRVLVPVFSSIKSKYGLHLKHGLKMPWAQVFFSERTVIRAMQRLATENPKLYELYPGLTDSPQRVRDLRRYKDLNDITYREFQAMARRVGFRVESFSVYGTRAGKVLGRLPLLGGSRLMDILSTGAAASLRKPQ
ncbi:MAG: class I SAM-dependent methyltransferase [Pirellulales bacterium]